MYFALRVFASCISSCDNAKQDLYCFSAYLLGIMEYGSLPNPKPFTVRFRIICMAQVLWFAINSGLRTDSCLKGISGVKELLVNMLEGIIQVTNAKLEKNCTEVKI